MNNLATKEKCDKLILDHRDMAKKITYILRNNIRFPHFLIEDCISQGYLGLIEAARKYSDEKNFTFNTYASIIIKGRIIDFIRKYYKISFGTKYNYSKNDRFDPSEIIVNTLEDDFESNQIINYSDNEYEKKFINPKRKKFLNENLEKNNGVEYLENRDLLKHFWSGLSKLEKKIFYLHFFKNMTCREIGKILGLSKSWISRIQNDVLISFRKWQKND